MSGCGDLIADAGNGVAPALRAVDCMSQQVTTTAFDRLLGLHGSLMPALTALLTLYIAIFALALLAGRTRLGIGALTQRMMGVGLVLAFATSWAAYQGVVWTLATGAPDELAGAVMGTQGSATQIFADRIDILFSAIAEISDSQQPAQPAPQPVAGPAGQAVPATNGTGTPAAVPHPGGVSPNNMLWAGATILLLATVGVLVTSRIILALMLALGPVFVVMALFPATRGLFVGWLRAMVLAATAPLLAVVGGAFTLELAVPAVNHLAGPDGIDARGAMTFFMIAAVHAALMIMVLRTAATIVGAWQVFPSGMTPSAAPVAVDFSRFPASVPGAAMLSPTNQTGGATTTGAPSSVGAAALPPTSRSHSRLVVTAPVAGGHYAGSDGRSAANANEGGRRASGIGSRFRAPPENRRLK